MPFTIRPHRRFPVQCSVTHNARAFQGHGTVWNLSSTGCRLSGDLPMRPEETLSLTVTLPNEQRIEVPEAVVRWSRCRSLRLKICEEATISIMWEIAAIVEVLEQKGGVLYYG